MSIASHLHEDVLKMSCAGWVLKNICSENYVQIIIKVSEVEFIFSKVVCALIIFFSEHLLGECV